MGSFVGAGIFPIVISVNVLYRLSSIKVVSEYERDVIFRLGRWHSK